MLVLNFFRGNARSISEIRIRTSGSQRQRTRSLAQVLVVPFSPLFSITGGLKISRTLNIRDYLALVSDLDTRQRRISSLERFIIIRSANTFPSGRLPSVSPVMAKRRVQRIHRARGNTTNYCEQYVYPDNARRNLRSPRNRARGETENDDR